VIPLEGSTFVVIGGSSGLGEGTARLARESGGRVTIVGRDDGRLRAAADRLGGVETASVDIADAAAVDRFFAGHGPVDHVVVTAGEILRGGIKSVDLADAHRFAESRYWGPIHVARSATFTPTGSLTLTSGTAAWQPLAHSSLMFSVVGAVEPLTRALAVELAPVRVNAICPGFFRTERTVKSHGSEEAADKIAEKYAALTVVKDHGRPEDAAEAILSLVTNPYISGEVLRIDGGLGLTAP
jgi:NAD(P)-dependent dehydrogenase (short-subunit alcohol dehydrogenase family)